ncbi:hypothetical protein [Halomonas sp. H2]|uniref:hypothetical protein n=1 Tax=unclassified Halomonas TaxID=2609666 RepID=UPI003CFA7A36
MADGYATERLNVMYNDFVIVGPSDDPASISDSESISDAMQLIAESGSPKMRGSRPRASGTASWAAAWAPRSIPPRV